MPLNNRRKPEKWKEQIEAIKLRQSKLRKRTRHEGRKLQEQQARAAHRKARKAIRDRLKWVKIVERQVLFPRRAALSKQSSIQTQDIPERGSRS
jgi:hypothetical protein